jgi:mRNA interferase HigB
MWVITKRQLREFWVRYPESEPALRRWYDIVEEADWTCFTDVRETFLHADSVDEYVVFNVGDNKYRVVAVVLYPSHKVLIKHVFTHKKYDRWNAMRPGQ